MKNLWWFWGITESPWNTFFFRRITCGWVAPYLCFQHLSMAWPYGHAMAMARFFAAAATPSTPGRWQSHQGITAGCTQGSLAAGRTCAILNQVETCDCHKLNIDWSHIGSTEKSLQGGTLPTSGMWIDSGHFIRFFGKANKYPDGPGKSRQLTAYQLDLLIKLLYPFHPAFSLLPRWGLVVGLGAEHIWAPKKTPLDNGRNLPPDPPPDRLRCRLQPTMPLHSGGVKVRGSGIRWKLLMSAEAAPIWDQWDQGRALHQRGSVLLAILANDRKFWRSTLVAVRWSLQEKVEVGSERYLSYLDVFSLKTCQICCNLLHRHGRTQPARWMQRGLGRYLLRAVCTRWLDWKL